MELLGQPPTVPRLERVQRKHITTRPRPMMHLLSAESFSFQLSSCIRGASLETQPAPLKVQLPRSLVFWPRQGQVCPGHRQWMQMVQLPFGSSRCRLGLLQSTNSMCCWRMCHFMRFHFSSWYLQTRVRIWSCCMQTLKGWPCTAHEKT